jgi:hypothetical protein
MAQKRFWDFKADDLTSSLNRWLLGIIPMGLYQGFDPAEISVDGFITSSDMNLRLNHATTGQKESDEDNTLTNKIGKFIAPQGIVVTEDTTIVLPINPNSSGHPRKDLIIATTEYVTIEGGADVVYSVVQGTPAAIPVAPTLPFPNKQTILGTITILGGTTTALGEQHTMYERPPYLFLGNRPDNFAYFDKAQVWEYLQVFKNFSLGTWQNVTAIVSEYLICNVKASLYKTTNSTNEVIVGINAPQLVDGSLFFIEVTDGTLTINPSGMFSTPEDKLFVMQKGDIVPFLVENPDDDTFIVKVISRSDYASIWRNNAFKGLTSFSYNSATWASNKLTIGDVNYAYYAPADDKTVDMISKKPDVTEQTIKNIGVGNLLFRHNQTPTTGFGKIMTMTERAVLVKPGEDVIIRWKQDIAYVVGGTYNNKMVYRKSVKVE